MTADAGPLAGLRVLDLTRLLPGPVCTLHLADLGADVVKVEDTGAGDYARTLGAGPGVPSAFYRNVNRNKRSVAIDLKSVRGRAAFMALARDADVVVESFRPGVVAALAVDHAAVAAVNPRVSTHRISGYGQQGPRAQAAGHDINYLALAGVLEQSGCAGGPPALSNLQVADLLGGAAIGAMAILAALLGAARTGVGRHVDVAMADATLAHSVFALQALEQFGATRARGTDLLTGGVRATASMPRATAAMWLSVRSKRNSGGCCARRSHVPTSWPATSRRASKATRCAQRSPRSSQAPRWRTGRRCSRTSTVA